MRGLIKVHHDALIGLCDDAISYINNFDIEPYAEKKIVRHWFKKKEIKHYSGLPHWYSYKNALINHFEKLKANSGYSKDIEIWLSELSYTNMVMLVNGNRRANPIFILDY